MLLYEEDNAASTLRAELNRLRNLLGEDVLASRPYRLVGRPRRRLARRTRPSWLAGDVAGALRSYRGPLLPRSTAPGVVRLREEIASTLRSAVLRSGVPDLMSTWTRSSWGSDDYEMWVAQRDAVGAPLAAAAAGPRPDRPARPRARLTRSGRQATSRQPPRNVAVPSVCPPSQTDTV